jgi:class 3 adenylate cyclase
VNPSKELEAVVGRFLDARVGLDIDAMKALNSKSEFLRQIGSDRDEWRQGFDATVQAWIDNQFQDSWRVTEASLLRIEAYENGETGWAAVEQERTLVNGQVFVFRITMVFVLEDYAWKLIQIHFSIPVADEQVLGVSLTSTLDNLLTSIDTDAERDGDLDGTVGTASLVFTDVVGSTSLSQSMGDRAWSELITDHFSAVEDIVVQNGGAVIKTLGDGGMYVFSAGTAALRAAIAMQQSAIGAPGPYLDLRIGIHTGDVVRTASDYLGLTVNKAARVAAAAEGGQILVSASTVGMINDAEFDFGVPIVAELKGIAGTHELRPLNWN